MKNSEKVRIVSFYFINSVICLSLILVSVHFALKYYNIKKDSYSVKAFVTEVNKDPMTHDLYKYGIRYVIDTDTISNIYIGKGLEKGDLFDIVVYKNNLSTFETSLHRLLIKLLICVCLSMVFIIVLIVVLRKPEYILKYSKYEIYYGD